MYYKDVHFAMSYHKVCVDTGGHDTVMFPKEFFDPPLNIGIYILVAFQNRYTRRLYMF